MRRRGFTIVEMMVVVTIISILLGITFVAVNSAMRSARQHQADVLCQTVETGLATYYAQKDHWPDPLGGKVESGVYGGNGETDATGQSDPDKYVLKSSEVRAMVKALVEEAKRGNPLLDISALFVSRDSGEMNGKGYGLDFMTAIRGNSRSKRKMSTSEMYYGYPDIDTGRFRRFKMIYSIPADAIQVMRLDQ